MYRTRQGMLAALGLATALLGGGLLAQDDDATSLDSIDIPQQRLPLCFGFSDIQSERALAICDALNLDENVRARELAEQWIRQQPDNCNWPESNAASRLS